LEARLFDLQVVHAGQQGWEGVQPFVIGGDFTRRAGRSVRDRDGRAGYGRARLIGHQAGDFAAGLRGDLGCREQKQREGKGKSQVYTSSHIDLRIYWVAAKLIW